MKRALRIVLGSIALLLLVAVVALVVVNGTYFGRERFRTFALDALRDMVHGEIMVGRIDGNLLEQFTLVDVTITDRDGQSLLVADSIRARVAIAPLLWRRVVITSIELDRPVITLSRTPGGDWNYKRIFESGDSLPQEVKLGFGSWVDLHGLTIRNGTLFVHQPFPGDEPVTRTVRDSAVVAALARDTRLRVERDGEGHGLRQTMEFRDINARIPRLVWADPDSNAVDVRVRELNLVAAVFQSPDVVVRDFSGGIRYVDDTVAINDAKLRLPQSRIEGELTYHVAAGDVELDLKSDTLALADLRALYPALPERGGGRMDLKATIRDTATSVYEVRNARLAVDESSVEGQFGMSLNSHVVEFSDTDLEFRRLTTRLIEQLAPGVDMRVPGSFTGSAKLDGPARAIRADVNGTFDPDRHAPFRFTARGLVGAGESFTARDLRLTANAVPVSLAREFVRDMPLTGTVNADAVVSGSTDSRFTGRATVTHRDNGDESTLIARGSVAPDDSMRMALDVELRPISLKLADRFAPSVGLQGVITGEGKVSGTPGTLKTTLALQLPAGTMGVDGTFDLASRVKQYQATVQLHNVDARAMVPTMPVTSLNGVTTIVGRGTDPKTIDARLTMRLLDAMVDSTQVIEATAVASARNARLTVDTMRVRTPFATLTATGTFGLAEGTDGTLTYAADVNTLSGLQRWIATGDTSVVPLRPLVRQRAAAQVARGDSLRRVADSANIGAMATRRDGQRPTTPLPALQASDALARDSIAGTLSVRGTVKGGIDRFTAEGKAAISQLVWGGNEIGRGTVDFTWADVRTPDVLLTAEMGVDSVRAAGFAFDSTHARVTYRNGSGQVGLAVFPGDTAAYRLRATYELRTDEGEVRLQQVNLRFDSTAWVSTRESVVRWRGGGLEIDSLELRSRDGAGGGRIFVNGELPDRDPGRLEVRVDSLRVSPWMTLLQATIPLDGVASVNAQMEGTRSSPTIRGSFALQRSTYRNTPFPEFHSDFTYQDRRLAFDGDLRRIGGGGAQIATLKGQLPVDLSFDDPVAKRTLDGPVSVDIEGDSIPLGPLAEFIDALSTVNGHARGKIGVRGTWTEPRLEGAMAVDIASLGLREAGITLTNTIARVHMDGDRLVIDTLVAHSGGGLAHVTGSVVLEELNRPVVDLRLIADEARVMDNAKGQLVMSSNVTFKGPIDTLDVNGSVTVMNGIIRIPDPEEFHLINTGDPVVFAVVDTAFARQLEVAPPSPIFQNANVDVRLGVRRGTWARSREANIEVYGELAIERSTGDEDMNVRGALFSDYGDYELYGRRFRIERGSVRFTGQPANPVLQLVANHEVRQAGRAPFDIQVTIGGTLEQPNISLESKAQPTLTQSDLISFLAFGQSSTSLLQFEGSGLEGGGQSGSSMAGNVATLATRQLAGVALGAMFAQLESDLTEKTAADVLNIKPADLPPGLTLGAVRSVALGTQIEYGKYLDRNTFFVGTFRPTFTLPGATIERRFGSQTRARLSVEPRYLPQVPSLTSGVQPKMQQVIGALLFWTRSW